MSHTNIKAGTIAVLMVAALLLAYVSGIQARFAFASAPSGLPATVATSSQSTVSTSGIPIFATSTCAARIITTEGSAIMLTFSDYAGQTPTGTLGHWQSASTTVAYDSGQYGCGLVKAYSYASQLLTLTETR